MIKKSIYPILFGLLLIASTKISAQENSSSEKYGKTLNIGFGGGYYGYIGYAIPVVNLNYEFDVAKNFTLAPFLTCYQYQKNYYWGNSNHPERYYYYRSTVIPVGVKGTLYLDQLFHASSKWDFYVAGSLGFAYRKTYWENGYEGERNIAHSSSGLYLDIHIGTEYRFNKRLGMYLDLSSGLSTLGAAIHW